MPTTVREAIKIFEEHRRVNLQQATERNRRLEIEESRYEEILEEIERNLSYDPLRTRRYAQ